MKESPLLSLIGWFTLYPTQEKLWGTKKNLETPLFITKDRSAAQLSTDQQNTVSFKKFFLTIHNFTDTIYIYTTNNHIYDCVSACKSLTDLLLHSFSQNI